MTPNPNDPAGVLAWVAVNHNPNAVSIMGETAYVQANPMPSMMVAVLRAWAPVVMAAKHWNRHDLDPDESMEACHALEAAVNALEGEPNDGNADGADAD